VSTSALAAEAGKKSRVCWLSYRHPGGEVRDRLVWHAWHDDAVVVVLGEPGQELPGTERLAPAGPVDTAEVTMRAKDTGGRLLTWRAAVEVVAPDQDRWEEHARALLAVRLNLTDPAQALERWRRSGTVVRLTPLP